MKIRIKQAALVDILAKGAIAALTDEAQGDTTVYGPILQSVKIRTDSTHITIESATKTLACQFKSPIDPQQVVVKEEGEVMILAKELCDWVNRQPDSDIVMNFKKFDSPQLISSPDGDSTKQSIKKIGVVELMSKDQSKTGSKWSLDCYDSNQINWIDFKKPDVLFEASQELIATAIKSTMFASLPYDNNHVKDTFGVQEDNKKLYLFCGDGVRIATYELEGAKNVSLSKTFVLPCKVLHSISGLLSPDEPVQFGFDNEKHRAFVFQTNYIVRAETIEQNIIDAKMPPLNMIFKKKYDKFAKMSKSSLASRLNTASLVNKRSVCCMFKGQQLVIHAISESGLKPITSNAQLTEYTRDLKTVWNVGHIMDIIKAIPDDEISFFMQPDNSDSFKVASNKNSRFLYFAMAANINETKYGPVTLENLV